MRYRSLFDWRDAMLLTGVAICCYGLYLLLPALAFIALGAGFVWYAIRGGAR